MCVHRNHPVYNGTCLSQMSGALTGQFNQGTKLMTISELYAKDKREGLLFTFLSLFCSFIYIFAFLLGNFII